MRKKIYRQGKTCLTYVFAITLLSIIFLLGCERKGKIEEEGEKYEFSFFYTENITNISCFSVELFQVEEETFSQLITATFSEKITGGDKISIPEIWLKGKSEKFEKCKEEGRSSECDIEIEFFPDKIQVLLSLPKGVVRNHIWLEMKGFFLPGEVSCQEIYTEYREAGFSDYLVALGRSQIIKPGDAKKSTGIFSFIFRSDTFGGILASTRAYPVVLKISGELEPDRYLICGGIDLRTKSVLRTCEIFDKGSISTRVAPPMNFPRVFASATKLGDGRVVISGGLDSDMRPIPFYEVFYPDLDVFLKLTRTLPRFKHYVFSTEAKIGIIGGIGRGGRWERAVEVFSYRITEAKSPEEESEVLKHLFTIDDTGGFGSCFAENDTYLFIIGGVGRRKIVVLNKDRIDIGATEVDIKEFRENETIRTWRETQEGEEISFGEPIEFGNCKAVAFGQRIVVASSYGKILAFVKDREEIKKGDARYIYPDETGITHRSLKSFSFQKVSDNLAVLFGGILYTTYQEGGTKVISPSKDVFLITPDGRVKGRYELVFPRQGGYSFMIDDYLIFIGGTDEGKSEAIFVGNVHFPSAITQLNFSEGMKEEISDETGKGGDEGEEGGINNDEGSQGGESVGGGGNGG